MGWIAFYQYSLVTYEKIKTNNLSFNLLRPPLLKGLSFYEVI